MTRLDALRAILAAKPDSKDQQRAGHTPMQRATPKPKLVTKRRA